MCFVLSNHRLGLESGVVLDGFVEVDAIRHVTPIRLRLLASLCRLVHVHKIMQKQAVGISEVVKGYKQYSLSVSHCVAH